MVPYIIRARERFHTPRSGFIEQPRDEARVTVRLSSMGQ
jgi:hypothetical protein